MREGRSKQKLSRWRRTKGEKRSEKKGEERGKWQRKVKEAVSCLQMKMGNWFWKGRLRGEREKKKRESKKKKEWERKKENYKMFLPYRHKIGWRVEDCQRSQKPPITHTRLTETWGISSGRYDCYLLVSGLLRERIKRSDTFLSRQQIKPLKTVSRFKNTEVSLVQYTNPTAADKMSARDSTNKEGKKM